MIRPKGLGRGLDALLSGGNEDAPREALQTLAIGRIKPGKYQPRTRMDETALNELADSIREQGLMQPILVRPVDGGSFEIIAGERRWRAAQRAGLTEVPALVKNVPDQAALALSLIENIQREDLNPLEEAHRPAAADRRIRPDARSGSQGSRPLAQRRDQPAAADRARKARAGIPAERRRWKWVTRARCSRCRRRSRHDGGPRGERQPVRARNGAAGVHAAQSGETAGAARRAARGTMPIRRASKPSSRKSSARKCRLTVGKNGAGKLVIAYSSLEQLDGILARLS